MLVLNKQEERSFISNSFQTTRIFLLCASQIVFPTELWRGQHTAHTHQCTLSRPGPMAASPWLQENWCDNTEVRNKIWINVSLFCLGKNKGEYSGCCEDFSLFFHIFLIWVLRNRFLDIIWLSNKLMNSNTSYPWEKTSRFWEYVCYFKITSSQCLYHHYPGVPQAAQHGFCCTSSCSRSAPLEGRKKHWSPRNGLICTRKKSWALLSA